MSTGRRLAGVLALGVAGSLVSVAPSEASVTTPPGSFGTPLPAGWEICVLESVGAAVNPTNVAALDVWQVAEGGSTQNANSYNPYNTKRFTGVNGAALPAAATPNGFPAFADWAAGCAATAATILQANMADIEKTLVAGNVSSPAGFLTIVDSTPWCAPENGVPCYVTLIAADARAGSTSDALTLLSDSRRDATAYDQDSAQVVTISGTLATERQELVDAENAVLADRQAVQQDMAQLRSLAVYDYTSNDSLDRVANLAEFEAQTQTDQLEQYYRRLDASDQVAMVDEAQATLGAAVAHRGDVADAVAHTSAALGAAQNSAASALAGVGHDIAAIEAAGGCPSLPQLQAVQTASAGTGEAAADVSALQGCVTALTT